MPSQWVRIIEHFPHRPILIWGLFISGIIAIVFGLSTKFYHLIALRALLGAVECLGLMANIMVGQLLDRICEFRRCCIWDLSWRTPRQPGRSHPRPRQHVVVSYQAFSVTGPYLGYHVGS
jgi:hypothetical protein